MGKGQLKKVFKPFCGEEYENYIPVRRKRLFALWVLLHKFRALKKYLKKRIYVIIEPSMSEHKHLLFVPIIMRRTSFLFLSSRKVFRKFIKVFVIFTRFERDVCRKINRHYAARFYLRFLYKPIFGRYLELLSALKELGQSAFSSINIRIRSNNVFCTLVQKTVGEVSRFILSKSAGSFKLNVSKRGYKYKVTSVIRKFFGIIRRYLGKDVLTKLVGESYKYTTGYVCVSMVVPAHIRYKFLRKVFKLFYRATYKVLINLCEKKIFNGCRSKKKRRKKRRGLRFLV